MCSFNIDSSLESKDCIVHLSAIYYNVTYRYNEEAVKNSRDLEFVPRYR